MGDCLDQPCTYLQDRTFEIIPENFVDGLCPSPIITRSCLEAPVFRMHLGRYC